MTTPISLAWRMAILAYSDAFHATDPREAAYYMRHGDTCIDALRALVADRTADGEPCPVCNAPPRVAGLCGSCFDAQGHVTDRWDERDRAARDREHGRSVEAELALARLRIASLEMEAEERLRVIEALAEFRGPR